MNRNVKLLLCGFVPLAAGYALNFLMYYLPVPVLLFNIVLSVLWGYFCYRTADSAGSVLVQTCLLSVVSLVMLALNLYCLFVAGAYSFNVLGVMCQLYFLPFLGIGAAMVNLAGQFGDTITMGPAFICSWMIFVVLTFIGVFRKARK